jgi:8-oxo-dGTP pyrophosphatase MutT (NUDIX family)
VIVALKRLGYRVAYHVLCVYWAIVRPPHRGVKCVATHEDRVLLVRHTYGRRRQWDFPGGGIKRGEDPVVSARREFDEELGVDVAGWSLLGERSEVIDHKRDRLFFFTAVLPTADVTRDPVEIAEVRWFPRDALPPVRAHWVSALLEGSAVSR